MLLRLYTPVFAFTLLVSAALLFSIQPLFSKMILPLLGGTPQVWTTAMLFFQVCLLAGYGYAHGTTRFLSIRVQAILHLILLGVFAFILPIAIPEGWVPPTDQDPTLWQLSLMTVVVGGPFFVLAGSAPMLQRWFSGTNHPHADNPYFLYGASNLGSMTSLLAYPTIIEPLLNLDAQSLDWSYGYGGLIVLVTLCGVLAWTAKPAAKSKASKVKKAEVIDWPRRFKWIYLAFLPSSMMLGVTTYITTDIASVPLIWVMPLALYVGTFIIVFANRPIISKALSARIFDILLIAVIAQLIAFGFTPIHPFALIALHFSLFFFAALMTHAELVDAKPSASNLTEFYLLMSVGGALGGVFNAIIAPQFFIVPIEYGLVLVLTCFLRYMSVDGKSFVAFKESFIEKIRVERLDAVFTKVPLVIFICLVSALFAFTIPNLQMLVWCASIIVVALLFLIKTRWSFAITVSILLLAFPPGYDWGQRQFKEILHQDRNFFGVIRVINITDNERILLHGTTNHGSQALIASHRMTPLSYYAEGSPLHDAFTILDKMPAPQNVGVVGLGVGVTACYTKNRRSFDFYEIDKDIADIAENPDYFTFLTDCGSPYEIILGDGRLTMQNAPDGHYDMILIDAFSSDNIPVHLLTREAVEIYLQKLTTEGILIFNISNNFLDLEPVLHEISKDLEVASSAHITRGGTIKGTDIDYYPSHFLVISRDDRIHSKLADRGWSETKPREGVKSWTDQYSNILSVLSNQTASKRMQDDKTPKVTHTKIKMVIDPDSNPLNEAESP